MEDIEAAVYLLLELWLYVTDKIDPEKVLGENQRRYEKRTREGARRTKKTWPVSFPKEQLQQRLTPLQFHVTQERGTESAFSGEFTFNKDEGTYSCVVCGTPLFSSTTKFDSGSGWPSFFELLKNEAVTLTDDFSYGMHRVESTCSQCGAHLGHLFDDGPRPTGKRYCINSASLAFTPQETPETTETPETPETKKDKTEL